MEDISRRKGAEPYLQTQESPARAGLSLTQVPPELSDEQRQSCSEISYIGKKKNVKSCGIRIGLVSIVNHTTTSITNTARTHLQMDLAIISVLW